MTENRDFRTARDYRPEPCVHSMTISDCPSCWHGVASRTEKENWRLREIIETHGDYAIKKEVANHDKRWLGGNAPQTSKDRWDVTKCLAYHPTRQTICRYDTDDHPANWHKDWEGYDFEAGMLADAMGVLCIRREGSAEMAAAPDSDHRREDETPTILRMMDAERYFWEKWQRVY